MTDGSVDLSDLLAACRDIAQGIRHCTSFHVLVIRSTVFPGTTSDLVRETVEKHSGKRVSEGFGLVAYPEFLREGYAVHDMLHPDRIVLGELDNHSGDVMEAFVREFYGRDLPPVLRVSPTTAELVKYASNAFLATKVAFVNEIANLCERFDGVDVRHVAYGMGYDPRIGRRFLDAGLGFGGSCLPKDLRALVEGAGRMGLHLRIAEAALASNEVQPLRVVSLAEETIGDLKGKRAAVLGLAFKPGTDDMREASSQKVVRALLQAGMRVSVYDPAAMKNAAALFGKRVRYAKDIPDCLKGTDCCFIVTEWEEFSDIQSDVFIHEMSHPVVIDGRRVLNPSKLDPRISYRAIGLGRRVRG
jgi:UDPglucose 6-dehydrogenase